MCPFPSNILKFASNFATCFLVAPTLLVHFLLFRQCLYLPSNFDSFCCSQSWRAGAANMGGRATSWKELSLLFQPGFPSSPSWTLDFTFAIWIFAREVLRNRLEQLMENEKKEDRQLAQFRLIILYTAGFESNPWPLGRKSSAFDNIHFIARQGGKNVPAAWLQYKAGSAPQAIQVFPSFYWAWNLYYTNNCHVDDDDSDAVRMYRSCLKTSSAAAAATMEKKRYVIIYIFIGLSFAWITKLSYHPFPCCSFVIQHNPLCNLTYFE